MFKWISASDLDSWARERLDSRGKLPEVARRLTYATLEDPKRISFRSEEGTQLGGWDGITETSEGNLYVPAGNSGWELSTDQRSKVKADDDYEKRTKDPLRLVQKETTFVYLTPRIWSKKDEWASEKEKEGNWFGVRAYDASDLEQWLEKTPAVGAWLAKIIGKYPEGALALSDFWDDWKSFTKLPLPPDLIVGTREDEADQVRTWLSRPPGVVSIASETQQESIAFLAAVAELSDEGMRNKIFARALLVEDEKPWRHLSATREHLILIPLFDVARVNLSPAAGHHVLLPITAQSLHGENALRLNSIPSEHTVKILCAGGFGEEEARRLANQSGKRLSVLRRFLAKYPETAIPLWARPEDGPSLTALLLVSRWLDTNDADRLVLEAVSQKTYRDLEGVLTRWANEVDAPVRKAGNRWEMVSHEDAWKLLQGYVTKTQLSEFLKQAEEVLGELNPRFELPPEERYLANTKGKVLSHSEKLREGIASTLALMGARGEPGGAYGNGLPQDWVDGFAYKLFQRSNEPHFWSSLTDVLPTLAEASPEQLLAAIERDLALDPSPLLDMFVDEGVFGGSPHTGLLWALERIAWEPRYLTRVTLIVGKLSRLDPGGRSGNRPAKSLREIFLSWKPQTSASEVQRIAAIDELTRREPDAAWDLLRSFLPTMHSFSLGNSRPQWRDWRADWIGEVTQQEVWSMTKQAIDRAISLAGTDARRWEHLLGELGSFTPEDRATAISTLNGALRSGFSSGGKLSLWDGLRRILHKNNQFSDAEGALPAEVMSELEKLYQALTPNDPFRRYAWLFSNNPSIPDIKTKDWYEETRLAEQERDAASPEIARKSIPEIQSFVREVEAPFLLGRAIGKGDISEQFESDMLLQSFPIDQSPVRALLIGFVAGRYERGGETWIDRYLPHGLGSEWLASWKAEFTRGLPVNEKTWDLVESCGDETDEAYWKSVSVHPISDVATAEKAISKLLKYGRPYAAIDLISFHVMDKKSQINRQLVLKVMQEAFHHDPGQESPAGIGMLSYQIGEILMFLELSGEVSEDELAQLEWSYLPLLEDGQRGSIVLHRRMQKDPSFFVELLSLVYRSEEEPQVESAPSKDEEIRAELAFELLYSWKAVPGKQEDGHIEANVLKEWVTKARGLSAQAHRTKAADNYIGQVFAYAPTDADGTWPDAAIRDVIEAVASERLDDGLFTGVYNKRGVWIKGPTEGGVQERALAKDFRDQADKLTTKWPRVAKILYRIAQDYESEALREDISADEI